MAYRIQITQKAELQLDHILYYLIETLCNPDAAVSLAAEIEGKYQVLMDTPYAYEPAKDRLRRLSKNPDSKMTLADVESLERFFKSNWYAALTSVEGEFLIRKIWELEEKINEQITKLVSLQSEIDEAINQMSDPAEKLLLKYRYLHNLDWTDVAGQMAISERTVHRIHSAALANVVIPEK